MLLILQSSNMEPLHSLKLPPATDGNKGQTTSSRINVTVSEVFVLKGLVNVYIYIFIEFIYMTRLNFS